MIPGHERWTVILSHQANAWGAFSYTPTEDAVRVTVTPKAAEFTERLQYSFDDPTPKTVTLTLRWEKLAVSVPVGDRPRRQVVLDSLDEPVAQPAALLGRGVGAGRRLGAQQHVESRPRRDLGRHRRGADARPSRATTSRPRSSTAAG